MIRHIFNHLRIPVCYKYIFYKISCIIFFVVSSLDIETMWKMLHKNKIKISRNLKTNYGFSGNMK